MLVPVGVTDGNMKGDTIKGNGGETSPEARTNQGFKYPTWDRVQYSISASAGCATVKIMIPR